jgi:beta-mannosidase
MFEQWKLHDFAPGEGRRAGAYQPAFDDAGWIDIPAPGDVHQALIEAGRVEDPFYDRNEGKCAWMEDREWWYRTSFDARSEPVAAEERIQLVFHGLDTYATIWLNGEELGSHRNMFRPAVFEVTSRLRSGANSLALCFDRPLDHVQGIDTGGWTIGVPERVAMRKAQFGYGWDWGPRLPTVGIWRPVELRRQRQAALESVHFATVRIDARQSLALVAVTVEAEQFGGQAPLSATIALGLPGELPAVTGEIALDGAGGTRRGTAYLIVPQPKLWWTHDLGEPTLYDLSVTLRAGTEEVAQDQRQVGIRTIALDQAPDPDEPGTRFFRFVLNGQPIFVRGADWIPAHSFVGAITPARYEQLVGAAQAAHMNMLRVWGGGIYEHDVFYALCDRLGLLVWQDFMFACAPYPEAPGWIVDEVDQEVRYQVRRLRSHPCLALWCGNNENQWIHDMHHWNEPGHRVPGAFYYDQIIPAAVAELDGHIPYWPGSPYGGNDHNSEDDGDSHNWKAWHGQSPRRFGEKPRADHSPAGVSYRRYGEDMSRFVSEYGMHAAPVLETLRRAIPADQLFHHSPSMDHHNKDNPKNKGDALMQSVTGLPTTLEEYIDFSMIAQAEGLKFGIEHFRRRKPHCSGTLFWQLNDCWPVLSWSVVDYYGFGKAGYYYAKRAYAPVLASFQEERDGRLSLWVTNDTQQPVDDTLVMQVRKFSGETLAEETVEVHIPPQGNHAVWTGRFAGGPDRYVVVRSRGGSVPANRHFFRAIRELRLAKVKPQVAIDAVDAHKVHVTLTAPAYVYLVHVDVSVEGTQFDDSYVDLEAGEQRVITVTHATQTITPDQVQVRWYVRQAAQQPA